jgi:acetyl-CoA carboxylase carboxyl transferase subunit alpha
MEMANRWGKPIITLIDTPGAFPGVGAEERGQAETIASSIYLMLRFSSP